MNSLEMIEISFHCDDEGEGEQEIEFNSIPRLVCRLCYSSPGLHCCSLVHFPLPGLLCCSLAFTPSSWSSLLLSPFARSALLLPGLLSFSLLYTACPFYSLLLCLPFSSSCSSSLPQLSPLLSRARLAVLAPFSRLLGHDLDRLSIILEAASQCPRLVSHYTIAAGGKAGTPSPLPPARVTHNSSGLLPLE